MHINKIRFPALHHVRVRVTYHYINSSCQIVSDKFLYNTHIHEGITLFCVLWSLVPKNNWNIFTAGNLLASSSLLQFWTVINWTKLTRYMSAYVQEPEPRGNTSDSCEILTQNRLLQNQTLSAMTSLDACNEEF